MAHPDRTKAQALALLALGNTPRYVSAQLGIPRTTVRRWQPEARAMIREIVGPELANALAVLGGELQQNGPKKARRRRVLAVLTGAIKRAFLRFLRVHEKGQFAGRWRDSMHHGFNRFNT